MRPRTATRAGRVISPIITSSLTSANHFSLSGGHEQVLKLVCRLGIFLGVCILLLLPAYSQDLTPKRGFQAGGSYAPGDIETVNTQSHAANVLRL